MPRLSRELAALSLLLLALACVCLAALAPVSRRAGEAKDFEVVVPGDNQGGARSRERLTTATAHGAGLYR